MDPKILDELSQKLAKVLPNAVTELGNDVQKNLRAALEAGLGKLNLVTREEFDVQSAVLHRTRSQVAHLEKQVAELEAQLLKKKKTK